MKIPLIITDSSGNLLYASRSVSVSGALRLWLIASSKNADSGIVYFSNNALLTKTFVLGGKKYRMFIDCDSVSCLGENIDRTKEGLFEVSAYASTKRADFSLNMLVKLFAENYMKTLFDSGARISVHRLLSDVSVNISPPAFALCLSLMVRLCGEGANVINLDFVKECGRVVIYADAVGGHPLKKEPYELIRTLLYEVSAVSGFAVCEETKNGKRSVSLSLTPLDVSLLGLKTDAINKLQKSFEAYIAMFL